MSGIDSAPIDSDEGTGPPLRQAKAGLQVRDGFALGGGPYHFFESNSRRAEASSMDSANSFLSLAFSSSRLEASGVQDLHAAVL